MSDIGRPLRRYHGVPREDPQGVPEDWPPPVEEPAQAPTEPLQPAEPVPA